MPKGGRFQIEQLASQYNGTLDLIEGHTLWLLAAWNTAAARAMAVRQGLQLAAVLAAVCATSAYTWAPSCSTCTGGTSGPCALESTDSRGRKQSQCESQSSVLQPCAIFLHARQRVHCPMILCTPFRQASLAHSVSSACSDNATKRAHAMPARHPLPGVPLSHTCPASNTRAFGCTVVTHARAWRLRSTTERPALIPDLIFLLPLRREGGRGRCQWAG